MMLLPWRSRARALFRTSKAVSVPRRDMRRASCSSYWMALSILNNSGRKPPECGKLDIIAPVIGDGGEEPMRSQGSARGQRVVASYVSTKLYIHGERFGGNS